MEEEDRVDGLAHGVVAAEAERDVGDAAGDEGTRQVLFDPARGLDEVHAVVGVLLDTRTDGEDVGVEDDVLGRQAHLRPGEDVVGASADVLAPLEGVRLAVLVEGHDDGRSAVALDESRLLDERLDALLHRDGVDDRLALDALEPGFDDVPLRGVDHDRDTADVGFGRDELAEAVHRLDAVDHPLVHVDVDDLSAVLDLLTSHRQGGGVIAVLDELAESSRTGDVRALTDVDEERVVVDGEGLEAGKP